MTLSLPATGPSSWARATFLTPHERPAVAAASAKISVIILCTHVGWIKYDGYVNDIAIIVALSWSLSTVSLILRLRVVGNLIRLTCVLLTMNLATLLATAALAVVSVPLADEMLMRIDNVVFGMPAWPYVIELFVGRGFILQFLSYAYVSLEWQLPALVILLCVLEKEAEAWRFATAWGLSLLACIAFFPLCPALGAYGYLHIDPSVVPDVLCHTAWHTPATIQNFKNGTFSILDANALEGIVTMPSFHACASVLLAWGFSRVPIMSWAMGVLNALMWVSAVPIGGHYVVDVIVGTAIAICAIFLSARLVPRHSSTQRHSSPSVGPVSV